MTTRLASVLALTLLLSCASPQPAQEEASSGFLHADGTKIVDGNGEEVILRGMGLDG